LNNSFKEVAFSHFNHFFSGQLLKTVILDGLSVWEKVEWEKEQEEVQLGKESHG
jgi:hypothetical protein